MLFLSQMPTDPPTTFFALSWIALGAMAAALVYVFRQWQAEKRNCTEHYLETIKQLMEALHEKDADMPSLDISDVKEK